MEEVAWSVHGSRVYAQYHAPKGKPKQGAVLVHGFRSCITELGDLPERLAESGIAALAIDLRGHGLSGGERGRIDLERAREDVDAAADWLQERLGKRPISLVGHSLGGALCLGIAASRDRFNAVVAAHPVDNLLEEINPVERMFFHGAGRLGQRRLRQGKSGAMLPRATQVHQGYVDRDLAKEAVALAYLQPKVNMGNYAFAATMDAASWAGKVNLPVLGIVSGKDRVVKPAHTERVFAAIGDLTVLVHDGGHACFRDRDRTHVIQGVIDFLKEHA